ncbi:PLDc N-terminal domain-containing protein [Corynebacterium uterequi]|uniref:Phospholipase_D-nuclease N-terminal n=1 Tax=Corynebacterium uterequi TaxID=1072256 RepID=A0A0G3HCQ5_9CORY|nr:PLDc N-terminal domain-containing protein [Corynebacterium uterequi]AKK11121.1 Phospholipase_D-nuclease N-terminal [Corynebacterium uterequi]
MKPTQVRSEFNDLPTAARAVIVGAGAAELAFKALAIKDLARRPVARVRGPKWAWMAAQLVNGFGPAAYFLLGRSSSRPRR